jgi:serine/threonine protein kinase
VSNELDQTADAGTQNAPMALAPGSHLGKYRLDRVLGEGGMGVVWAAHDPDLERAVAIKVLRYAEASQQLRQRLLREARAMAKLKHPNVLTVYEVGTVGDRDYIAMELVDGMSLDNWLALGPTPDEIWSAVLAAGRGLAAAHEAGVVHRDFKPHNVLRSRGGRVLVTDFGLARGMLAETDRASLGATATLDDEVTPFGATLEAPRTSSPASASHASAESLLASPLTQTGALIGTPAYMAPEQYRGAPPDPRTDQFAFCVTAWQALTGERPFKGTTLDEMRTAASGGVAHIQTKLPGEVRAVLARGLDPVAAQRWPSLEGLLDELERAGAAPARRRRRIGTLAAGAGAVALAATMFLGNRSGSHVRTGCDDPDQQFGEAWSPAIRATLAQRMGADGVGRIAVQLDNYAERWIESYAKACRGRPAKQAQQRIACLEGLRDHAAAITTMLGDVDKQVLEKIDPREALAPLASCETAGPLAPPRVPREQPRRGQILKLMGRSLALSGAPPAAVARTMDGLLAEAQPLSWPPLASFILVVGGNRYMRSDEPALARAAYRRALASLPGDIELRDARVEGSAYLGLFEASLRELENPRAALPPAMKTGKGAKAPLHGELVVQLTKATNAASNDPLLLGARSLLASMAYAHAAQWNRYASGYDEALRLITEARKQFDELGDVARSAFASSIEAQIYLQRGDDRALDDALFAARRAQDTLAAAGLPTLPELDDVRATVAFARRDFGELYRIHKAHEPRELPPNTAPLLHGRVVGDSAQNAVIVVWPADLVGHARSIAMVPWEAAEIVHAERDGTFEVHANPDWMIMAEALDTRSTPRLVGRAPLTIDLKPTVTLSGEVTGANRFGVKVFARYSVGAHHWDMQAPVDKDGTFDLRGLPPGPRVYGTEGPAGTGERTLIAGAEPKQISWSSGQALEVIVRAKELGDGAQAWVVRGAHEVTTRAQLDALVAGAPDVAHSGLEPVGASNTDAGREVYLPGDRHAVITGNYAGQIYTVCATSATGGPFACKQVTVENTMLLEYADGRVGAGVTPILFEL